MREGTILHDLQLLDHDLQNVEHESQKIKGLANQVDMRVFVNAIRVLYKTKMCMIASSAKARSKITYKEAVEEKVDKKLHEIFVRMSEGGEFSPTEIATLLEKSIDMFDSALTMQVRYQPVAGGSNFMGIGSHVGARQRLFLELQKVLNKNQMSSALEMGALTRLRTKVSDLANKRYPDLLKYLQSFDKLVQEFNTRLHNFYVITENLDMIKGVPLKPKRTFFGFKIPGGDGKRAFDLTSRDEVKIKGLQGSVAQMHDVTVKALRERQRQIIAELGQIKKDETDVRSIFKRSFAGGKKRIKLFRAA